MQTSAQLPPRRVRVMAKIMYPVVLVFLLFICVSSAVGQQSQKPAEFMYGQLTLLGALVVVLVSINSIAEARVRRIVRAELNDPDSALGEHKVDASAHEAMRDAMTLKLDERLGAIARSIEDHRKEARADLSQFQQNVLQPILKQNADTLTLLARTMDRERRFVVSKDHPDLREHPFLGLEPQDEP